MPSLVEMNELAERMAHGSSQALKYIKKEQKED